MTTETKTNLRSKARLLRGFASILEDDIARVHADIEDREIVSLEESIRDSKETLQCLIDTLVELEYAVYISKREVRH
jgi:hypothetical protein